MNKNFIPLAESEKASNAYLMSVVALMAGAPLPIFNLLGAFIFFYGYRKASYFVRWHCWQALLSQLAIVLLNSYAFWWTYQLVSSDAALDNSYISYILFVILINIAEIIGNIRAAIAVRKGAHFRIWMISDLADSLCKPNA